MEKVFGTTRLGVLSGDLTRQDVDAIVNAANPSLMGGGGVDGAIHRAGGPAILEECRRIVARIGRLATGRAVITTAGNLPARHVIHTVGPVWGGGARDEASLLAECYRSSLRLAEENALKTVAFPAISTGAYGYPLEKAARVAVAAIAEHLRAGSPLEEVRVVVLGHHALQEWERALATLG